MLINGELCEDANIISEHIQEFYKSLFTESGRSADSLLFLRELLTTTVTSKHNRALVYSPSETKVKRAVFDMSAVSASGPDGFGGSFYQATWDIVGWYVFNAVGFFFTTSLIPAGLNSNVVTLIPKVVGATKIEDFCPIVLGNFLFKILTKIISNRIGPMLHTILLPSHYGFIPGQKIQHCIATCSESVQCLNKIPRNMALKIDI